MSYPTDLTPRQKILISSSLGKNMPVLRKYDVFSVFNAISYVMKTGCQWQMLPKDYPPFHAVYHHFRTWSAKGWFTRLLKILTAGKRASMGLDPMPDEAIIDSQSVRSALPQSQKGIDGHKRIKGIKRHVAVDENGYVLDVSVSTANIHDSKGARPLIANIINMFPELRFMKADKAYAGPLQEVLDTCSNIELECVKSNFGSSDFIPIAGRWVVERTFSWMENYRRATRNYERYLISAKYVFLACSVIFMLRYFT